MNQDSFREPSARLVSSATLAGLAGGAAEMAWIGGYSAATPLSSVEVLRQIPLSVGLDAGTGALALMSGVAIHLGLSVLLGVAFALAIGRPLLRRYGLAEAVLASCATLGLIWVTNFFLVLPLINPAFTVLMPYGVTLASKLLFGVAMGSVFYWREHQMHRTSLSVLRSV